MNKTRKIIIDILQKTTDLLAHEVDQSEMNRRALVFAPHQDDEVLGCGGTIVRKLQSGAQVHVVFMTDGATSHAGRIPSNELKDIRKSEAYEAAAILGLSADRITFLDFPDSELTEYRSQAVERVRSLIASFAPDEVLVPHAADRLSDHVETCSVVAAALAGHPKSVRILEYPVWLWHTWPWIKTGPNSGRPSIRKLLALLRDIWRLVGGCRARVNIGSVKTQKRDALRAYRSQTQRRNGDPGWPILADVSNGEFLACFEGDTERFRSSWYRP